MGTMNTARFFELRRKFLCSWFVESTNIMDLLGNAAASMCTAVSFFQRGEVLDMAEGCKLRS
jgi:hypothetical protein